MEIRLSSFKRGHGLKELLSKDTSEYWATDDALPHGLQVKFNKLTYIHDIRAYLSFTQDDSYTPQEIEIRCGLAPHMIETISNVNLIEPEGFFSFDVKKSCFYLQLIILSNHQEGKDSHIRHLKIMESSTKELYLGSSL